MFFSKAPSMTLGIAALAAPGRGPRDDLWMGSAAGEPIPWRVLSREGNGGRYRNAAEEEVSGPALLLVTSCQKGFRPALLPGGHRAGHRGPGPPLAAERRPGLVRRFFCKLPFPPGAGGGAGGLEG